RFACSRSSLSRRSPLGLLAPVLDADAVSRWEWPAEAGRKRSAAAAAGHSSGAGPDRNRMR
ncbi:hypothetical protein, partial [Dietzia sp. Die43]|uniref:hypothetical protein n=1 Tax=Dietzia sp. Die43 TaxID=2926011 RepID=UPI002117F437